MGGLQATQNLNWQSQIKRVHGAELLLSLLFSPRTVHSLNPHKIKNRHHDLHNFDNENVRRAVMDDRDDPDDEGPMTEEEKDMFDSWPN